MSDGQGNAPPGGYFIGRPANTEEQKEQPQAPAEPAPVNESLPGDYFVGRPANQQQNDAAPAPEPGFLAKCLPCLGGGKVAS